MSEHLSKDSYITKVHNSMEKYDEYYPYLQDYYITQDEDFNSGFGKILGNNFWFRS